MGNSQYSQEFQRKINELQVVKKNSHYSILKALDGTEYIKFLYSPIFEQSQGSQHRQRTNSIFNQKYIKYRYQSQQKQGGLKGLPKIVAFGEQPSSKNIISCTDGRMNFILFEHPVKTLKQQIDNRITAGEPFKEFEYLSMIRTIIQTLSHYFEHIKLWNEQILEKKNLTINQENIYVNHQGEFIVSDILVSFNEIENISKQEVTLKKSSRANSMTNLHAKITGKKLRQRFFQTNLNNLASIIEGIMFKFQCFSQPHKNSFQQSQSLSTALESYRGFSKNTQIYSFQFEKLLKQLRQSFRDQSKFIEQIDRIFTVIHLPIPIQNSQQSSKVSEVKYSFERVMANSASIQKLNGINSLAIPHTRTPLGQIQSFSQNPFKKQPLINQKSNEKTQNRRTTYYTSETNEFNEQKALRINTKIRLSLKKDTQTEKQQQNREPSIKQNKSLKRKTSHPKFLCATKNHEAQLKDKQNFPLKSIVFDISEKRKRSQSLNAQKLTQKMLNAKLNSALWQESNSQPEKKKIVLKKSVPQSNQKPPLQPKSLKTQEPSSTTTHTNPMSRKKTFGLNKLLTCKSNEKVQVFKTQEKLSTPNEMDLEFIENLSSIISNQNNTLSSYGIPLTDEFRTDNSLIEDEGCVGFTETEESSPKNWSKKVGSQPNECGQFSKKPIHTLSPPCVKLSSYPSLQLVESIIERPQDKIPQFLKQFKLPQKHLLALNNIILKQKDMIVEESFEQSEFNSIRHSVPNILALQQQINDLKSKRNSKIIGLDRIEAEIINKTTAQIDFSGISLHKQQHDQIKHSFLYERQGDSIERQLKCIETSLINNVN